MIDDYEALAAQAFDQPYTGELRQCLRVCADALEAAGDPRGTLIALGDALHDAPGGRPSVRGDPYREPPARNMDERTLRRAIDDHVLAHHAAELGEIAKLLQFPRALVLDWRAGRLYGAHLDARYIGSKAKLTAAELVRMLLDAPAAAGLRRLSVRVRKRGHADDVLAALCTRDPHPPLEELAVLMLVRPLRLDRGGWSMDLDVLAFELYPRLYLYAGPYQMYSLPPTDPAQPPQDLASRVLGVAAPLDPAARTLLGRALTSSEPVLRHAALTRIGALRDHADLYVDTLALLLQPGMVAPQLPVLECLRALGPIARRALPVVVKIPGRVEHYDVETRRAAGRLIDTLRAAPPAPSYG